MFFMFISLYIINKFILKIELLVIVFPHIQYIAYLKYELFTFTRRDFEKNLPVY